MLPLLADYNDAAGAAGLGIFGLFAIAFYIFLFVYAIIAFFVPFYIYRIMRRQTENNEVLRSILNEVRAGRTQP
jgi:hypothetical protein